MKVLVIAPRAPQTDGKGDAIRAAALMAALQRNHDVELFVPGASMSRRALAAVVDLIGGRPAQVGFSMPPREWAAAQVAAADTDVVVAITVRAVRGPLPVPLIVDHVDALSLNWALRARGPEGRIRRLVARLEARRLRRWELRVAGWSVTQLVLSEQDVRALPSVPAALVIPQAVAVQDSGTIERDIDVVFTGNMKYPPNKHAALWLDREILPALRALCPSARTVIAGRDADRLPLRFAETMSDVPSIPAVLSRSRVAVVPLIGIGTGIPNKVLEAAACGAALVVTPWLHDRLPLPARVAADACGLAANIADLLADEAGRASLAQQARTALLPYGIERIAEKLDPVIESAARKPGSAGRPAATA